MALTVDDVLRRLRDQAIERVDLGLCDLSGRWHHLTVAAELIQPSSFSEGVSVAALPAAGFGEGAASAVLGGESLAAGDLQEAAVVLDAASAWRDPFLPTAPLSLFGWMRCRSPGHPGCARSLASRATEALASSGLADTALFQVAPHLLLRGAGDRSAGRIPLGEHGQAAVLPERSLAFRSELLSLLGTPAPLQAAELLPAADGLLRLGYTAHQLAACCGLSAALVAAERPAEAAGCLPVSQSLRKSRLPLFYGEGTRADLSQTARWYIGGLLLHAPALLALTGTGASIDGGWGGAGSAAPLRRAYAPGVGSTVVGLPVARPTPASQRLAFVAVEAAANPYVSWSALLLAGLDGIRRQIDPGGIQAIEPSQPPQAHPDPFPPLPTHPLAALEALAADHAFLLEGDVFSSAWIAGWIERQRRRLPLAPPQGEPFRPF